MLLWVSSMLLLLVNPAYWLVISTWSPPKSLAWLQEYTSIIHISSINVARRPTYVRLALWFLHHPAWMESHTGGSRLTPTVHPCPVQLGRLWVAYVSYEHAQPVHGSGARVQDHDPGTSQPETQTPRQSAAHSQQGSQEMLENATSVTTFGKKDTSAESQSHAARTQDTLVNAVENAEVNEIIRAVFRQRRRNSTRLPDLERRSPTITTRPSDTKPCLTSSRQRLLQARMTKKKSKDASSAGAVNAAQQAGETVETKHHLWHPVFFHTSKHQDRLPSCQH